MRGTNENWVMPLIGGEFELNGNKSEIILIFNPVCRVWQNSRYHHSQYYQKTRTHACTFDGICLLDSQLPRAML